MPSVCMVGSKLPLGEQIEYSTQQATIASDILLTFAGKMLALPGHCPRQVRT
jgi:hypothetical protein